MLPTEPEKQKLAAALEQLEAEQRRRDDERVAAGAAIRAPLYIVPHGEQNVADATEEAKARKLAELRAIGDQRAVLFEEPFLIHTGVPRPAERKRYEPEEFAPKYPDRYTKERQGRPEPQDDEPMEPLPPVEWHKFTTTVRNPDGKNDHGQVDENLYSIQGDTLAVKTLDGRPMGTLELRDGDEILAAARKVVREKGRSGAFWDPITLPAKPRP
jgi:hypothetical protein